jgi:catechol 2,3-dioxygenase-like lactoylglutathione lyase family enzyme
MNRRLAMLTLVVPDYDEAIDFYTRVMRFTLIEDTALSAAKRWVVVSPGEGGAQLLLARAATPEQAQAIGHQSGGRVFLFLQTSDFDGDVAHLRAHEVRFAEAAPRDEAYGRVIVFHDLYGNKWDLIEPKSSPQARIRSQPPEGNAAGLGAARRPA